MLISNEPVKNCSPSKISQSINGEWALVIEMVTILLVKARKNLVVWWSEERSIEKKKKWNKGMGSENFISTRFRYIFKLFRGAKEKKSW